MAKKNWKDRALSVAFGFVAVGVCALGSIGVGLNSGDDTTLMTGVIGGAITILGGVALKEMRGLEVRKLNALITHRGYFVGGTAATVLATYVSSDIDRIQDFTQKFLDKHPTTQSMNTKPTMPAPQGFKIV